MDFSKAMIIAAVFFAIGFFTGQLVENERCSEYRVKNKIEGSSMYEGRFNEAWARGASGYNNSYSGGKDIRGGKREFNIK